MPEPETPQKSETPEAVTPPTPEAQAPVEAVPADVTTDAPESTDTPTEPSAPAADAGDRATPPAGQQTQLGQFRARPASVSDKPRRVRAGRKLNLDLWPERLGWAGRRWHDAVKAMVPENIWKEGLDYAERGQTRRIETHVCGVEADIQGRPYRPYTTELMVRPFEHERWDEAVRELVKSSVHAAKLLAGEMHEAIQDDVFASIGLDLFPSSEGDVRSLCNCRETGPWCKHAVCVALLIAEDLDSDPFLLFRLRGLEGEDLLEKLRQRRELESTGGSAPASALRLPFPGDDAPIEPMESCVDSYWESPQGLDEIETTPRRPEVKHALLRRLGPSPFDGARFPLSGLLATCYDTFTREALGDNTPSDESGDTDGAPKQPEEGASKGPQLSAAARLLRAKMKGKAAAKAKKAGPSG